MEWNGMEFRINVFKKSIECFTFTLNGLEQVSKSFFFCLMVRNKIQNVFLFCEMVRNEFQRIFIIRGRGGNEITKLRKFLSSMKWLEQNSEPFLSSGKWLRTKFWAFPVPRCNSDRWNEKKFLFPVPWNNFFLGKWQPLFIYLCIDKGT